MASESTRRFTKNLLKPGTAAEIRQTASNAVRHSATTVSKRASTQCSTVRWEAWFHSALDVKTSMVPSVCYPLAPSSLPHQQRDAASESEAAVQMLLCRMGAIRDRRAEGEAVVEGLKGPDTLEEQQRERCSTRGFGSALEKSVPCPTEGMALDQSRQTDEEDSAETTGNGPGAHCSAH
ncbi:unnamed protein product [Lota lota]